MEQRDIDSLMRAASGVVREFVSKELAPIRETITQQREEIAALKARQPVSVSGAHLNKSGNLVFLFTDGKSVDVGPVEGPAGNDGAPGEKGDAGERGDKGETGDKGEQGDTGPAGKGGEPGRGIDHAEINEDGELVLTYTDGEEKNLGHIVGEKGEKGDTGDAGPEGKAGEDGKAVTEATIDKDGSLTLTFSDGSTKSLGCIVGKDGKNGTNGKDGAPGLGFEDIEEELHDEGRVIIRRYKRGAEVKEFRHRVPAIIYRGIFKEGSEYDTGDQVTWAGSQWTCMAPTNKKPGDGNAAWQLSAKCGRDGKSVDEDAVVERIMGRVTKELEKHVKGAK